jgi:hypothetical protein
MIFEKAPAAFAGQECWVAKGKKKQFVIVKDYGKFTASFRKLGGSKTIHIIDYDNRVDSFIEAKEACEEVNKDQ